jgi:hypothetical protein
MKICHFCINIAKDSDNWLLQSSGSHGGEYEGESLHDTLTQEVLIFD